MIYHRDPKHLCWWLNHSDERDDPIVAFLRFIVAAFFLGRAFFFELRLFFRAAAEISVRMDCGTFFVLQVDLGIVDNFVGHFS